MGAHKIPFQDPHHRQPPRPSCTVQFPPPVSVHSLRWRASSVVGGSVPPHYNLQPHRALRKGHASPVFRMYSTISRERVKMSTHRMGGRISTIQIEKGT